MRITFIISDFFKFYIDFGDHNLRVQFQKIVILSPWTIIGNSKEEGEVGVSLNTKMFKAIHETKLELSERAGYQTQFPLWEGGGGSMDFF